jgi:hypothetical protein
MGEDDTFPTLQGKVAQAATTTTVADFSGNGYNGSMISMSQANIILDAPGREKSVLFGGTDEYVTVGNVLAFERTNSFSLSLWFKTTDTAGGYLLGKMSGSTAYRGYGATYNANGSLSFQTRSDDATNNRLLLTTTSTGWNNGAWHHVVWTYAGTSLASGVCCYVDGALQTLTVGTDALTATIVDTSSFWLGGANSASAGWLLIGSLDEVSVYSDVLTPTEVTWIYNGGAPRALTDSGCPSNLAAWWKMGDGDTFPTLLDSGPGGWVPTYPTITDYSGSGYTGTMTNMETTDVVIDAPTTPTGPYSTAFEGTNEYVNMGNVLGFERTDPFTLAFWVKYTSVYQMTVLSKMYGGAPFAGYEVMLMNGQITLWLLSNYPSNYFRVDTVGTFNDGAWHHVIVTYTGSSAGAGVKIYVDNVERGTTVSADSLTASILTSVPFNLGIRNLGADAYPGPLVGRLNNVGIWNRVLSSDERTPVYNGLPSAAPDGLVGWWRMGEASIGPLNGTMTNMEWNDIRGDRPGTSSVDTRCLMFPGSNARVDCGNVTAFDRYTPFSVSLWVRTMVAGGCLVSKSNGGIGWYVESSGGNCVFYLLYTWPTNVMYAYSQGGTLNDGKWHHLIATYTGSGFATGMVFYIDGSPVTAVVGLDILTNSVANSSSLMIGYRDLAYPNSFIGSIDDVAVYSRVLTAAEAAWIYNSGVPRDLKASDAPSNLAAYWRLGEAPLNGTMTNMEAGDILSDSPDMGSEAQLLVAPAVQESVVGGGVGSDSTPVVDTEVVVVKGYKMRAQDSGVAPPGYVTWSVTGSPDFAGAGYVGGTPTPIGSMVPGSATVVASYEVN